MLIDAICLTAFLIFHMSRCIVLVHTVLIMWLLPYLTAFLIF